MINNGWANNSSVGDSSWDISLLDCVTQLKWMNMKMGCEVYWIPATERRLQVARKKVESWRKTDAIYEKRTSSLPFFNSSCIFSSAFLFLNMKMHQCNHQTHLIDLDEIWKVVWFFHIIVSTANRTFNGLFNCCIDNTRVSRNQTVNLHPLDTSPSPL